MKDVRKLVPRTPPEGLLEWAAERHKELDQDGLLIETEWAQDWSLEVMLDEWAENRKVRAIRATCSACCYGVAGMDAASGGLSIRAPGQRERAARCAPMGIRPPVPGVANRSLSAGKPMCGKRDGSWLRRDMS